MNINRGFIIAMVGLAVFAFIFSYRTGVEYTYSDHDLGYVNREPLGIQHVDEVLKTNMPRGYEVVYKGFFELTHSAADSCDERPYNLEAARYNYFYVANPGDNINSAVGDIDWLMKNGSTVFVVADYSYLIKDLSEYLGVVSNMENSFSYYSLEDELCSSQNEIFLRWCADSVAVSAYQGYWLPSVYFSGHVCQVDSDEVSNSSYFLPQARYDYIAKCAEDKGGRVVRITSPGYGGSIIFCSMPHVFTNFALIHSPEGRALMLSLMSLIADKPVRRLALENVTDDSIIETTTSVIGQSSALEAAYLLTIVTCLVAMVFTARRRQRVIPVIGKPVNRVMEMTLNVGDLYYRRHDNVDLVMKRYAMFVEAVRRDLMLDLETDDRATILRELAAASGMSRDAVGDLLDELQRVSRQETITDRQMIDLINGMDSIETAIKF